MPVHVRIIREPAKGEGDIQRMRRVYLDGVEVTSVRRIEVEESWNDVPEVRITIVARSVDYEDEVTE